MKIIDNRSYSCNVPSMGKRNVLTKLREENEWSMKFLARKVGAPYPGALCHYESRRRKLTWELAVKVHERLGIPLRSLVSAKQYRLAERIAAAVRGEG